MKSFPFAMLLMVSSLCFISAPLMAADSTAAPLEAKKPLTLDYSTQADFDRWKLLLKNWRKERDQLHSAKVVIRGEMKRQITSSKKSGDPGSRIYKQLFQLEGLLNLKERSHAWTKTNYVWNTENRVSILGPGLVPIWQLDHKNQDMLNRIPILDKDKKSPSTALYWNPLYAGFRNLILDPEERRRRVNWYQGLMTLGKPNRNDTIRFSKDEASGLLKVKIKSFNVLKVKTAPSGPDLPGIISHEFCFNEKQGLTLISYKIWLYPENIKQPTLPFRDVSLNWEKIDSFWVPTSITDSKSTGRNITRLKLEWSDLNMPLEFEEDLDWSRILLTSQKSK